MPCRNRVERGQERCDQCLTALRSHPNAKVRKALAVEPNATISTLELLATDLDLGVALTAKTRLREYLNHIYNNSAPPLVRLEALADNGNGEDQ